MQECGVGNHNPNVFCPQCHNVYCGRCCPECPICAAPTPKYTVVEQEARSLLGESPGDNPEYTRALLELCYYLGCGEREHLAAHWGVDLDKLYKRVVTP